jgi:Transferase family
MPFVFSQTLDFALLTTSLANTLTRYPLFSGRLKIDSEGDYSVALNNAGASLTIAKCNDTTLNDLLPEGMLAASDSPSISTLKNSLPPTVTGTPGNSYTPEDMTPFLPKTPALILGYRNKDVPLFQAQITYLKNGGTVLGIAVPHLLADQETCRFVFKAWADAYTALDVRKMGGDIQQQQQQNTYEVEADGRKSSKTTTTTTITKNIDDSNKENNSEDATDALPIIKQLTKAITTTTSAITTARPSIIMGGQALESHATPALPAGWKSSRFEKRNWSYVPSILGRGVGNTAMAGLPVTVAYYVSATRLGELKAEASKYIAAGNTTTTTTTNTTNNTTTPWISTNDALVARLRQAIAQSLPGKAGRKDVQLVVDLRKRMKPALPAEAVGNCSWTVAVGSDANATETPSLGALAAEIRAAILELGNSGKATTTPTPTAKPKHDRKKNINNVDICNELRWMISNGRPGGAKMPVVFQNFSDMVQTSGPLLVSHWDWGGAEYKDISFGGGPECTPAWHQPTFPKLPNCVFIVPAVCGGALVHITLHKKLAKKLKAKCPSL